MTPMFQKNYDEACNWFRLYFRALMNACNKCNISGTARSFLLRNYWGVLQSFFKIMCISAKIDTIVKESQSAVRQGMCVVIGLQGTGENALKALMDDMDDEIAATSSESDQSFIADSDQSDSPVDWSDEHDSDRPSSRPSRKPAATKKKKKGKFALRKVKVTKRERMAINFDEIESGCRRMLMQLVKKHFPTERVVLGGGNANGSDHDIDMSDSDEQSRQPRHPHQQVEDLRQRDDGEYVETVQECVIVRDSLIKWVEGLTLPPSPLDDLIDRLGGPSKVAEMTGRHVCMYRGANGKVKLSDRSTGGIDVSKDSSINKYDQINIREADNFNSGKKKIAIISDAASTGISLHASDPLPESGSTLSCHTRAAMVGRQGDSAARSITSIE